MTISAGSIPCPPFITDQEAHRKAITQWMFRVSPFIISGSQPQNFITAASLSAFAGASVIGFNPAAGMSSSNVQAAILELKALVSPPSAGAVQYNPVGVITENTVQSAVAQVASLQAQYVTKINLSLSTGASIVGFSPAVSLTSTTVQNAIIEVKNLIAGATTSLSSGAVTHTDTGTSATATTAKAKLMEWVSAALDFGADPTGVADSQPMIQAALNTGRNVFLAPGVYLIGSGVTINTQGQTLMGAGRDNTYIRTSANGFDALTLSANYASVTDLTFSATAQRTSNAFVRLNVLNQRGNNIERVKMRNPFYGIHISNEVVITAITDCEILDSRSVTGIGVFIDGGNDTFLTRVVMDATPTLVDQPNCGVRIKKSQAVWMTDCDLIHQGTGLKIDPGASAGDLITWCFFNQVCCDGGANVGLYVAPLAGAPVKGLFFNNCWFSSNAIGAHLLCSAADSMVNGIFFNACQFLNNRNQGAYAQSCNIVAYDACHFIGNSTSLSGGYAAIESNLTCNHFSVRNCFAGPGISFPSQQKYGLFLSSATENIIVTNNNFRDNVTGAVVDGAYSVATLRSWDNNVGYVTQARGLATVASGTAGVVVTHGLANTPLTVFLTPLNSNTSPGVWWGGSLTSTTFTINFNTTFATPQVFCWSAHLYPN